MQERKRIVPEKDDVGIVYQCREVERVTEEGGKEVTRTAGEEWE